MFGKGKSKDISGPHAAVRTENDFDSTEPGGTGSSDGRAVFTPGSGSEASPGNRELLWTPSPGLAQPPVPSVGDVRERAAPNLDARDLFRLPSVSSDAGRIGDFQLSAASVLGARHAKAKTTNQDSYSFCLSDDEEAVVVAVSDGLGSRPSSHIGASALVRFACHYLAKTPSEKVLESPASFFRDALYRANRLVLDYTAPQHNRTPEQLLSTLCICWVPNSFSTRPGLVARVGDATCFTARSTSTEDHPFTGVFPKDTGALNEVSGTLPVGFEQDLRFDLEQVDLREIAYLAVVSDGVSVDLYSSADIRQWLASRWSVPGGTTQDAIQTLSYLRQGSHDDRTAIVVWRPEVQPGPV